MSKVPLLISLILLLTSISAAGAISVENVIKLNVTETELWDPVISPDGTKVAYIAYDDQHIQQVFVINTDGTERTKLTSDGFKKWGLAWEPDKIAYVSFGKDGLEKIFVINLMALRTNSSFLITQGREIRSKDQYGLLHHGVPMGNSWCTRHWMRWQIRRCT